MGKQLVQGVSYYSPYKHPKGKVPEGLIWTITQKHPEKGYPISWELRSTTQFQSGENDFPTFAGRSAEAIDRAASALEENHGERK